MQSWSWTIVVLLISPLILGCGAAHESRGAVQGKITVNGAPLPQGEISFVALGSEVGPSSGAAVVNGEYSIPAEMGPLEGKYQVQIRAFRGSGKKVWDGMGDDKAPGSQKNMVEQLEPYLPARYNDLSELQAQIIAGRVNEHNFDLQLSSAGR